MKQTNTMLTIFENRRLVIILATAVLAAVVLAIGAVWLLGGTSAESKAGTLEELSARWSEFFDPDDARFTALVSRTEKELDGAWNRFLVADAVSAFDEGYAALERNCRASLKLPSAAGERTLTDRSRVYTAADGQLTVYTTERAALTRYSLTTATADGRREVHPVGGLCVCLIKQESHLLFVGASKAGSGVYTMTGNSTAELLLPIDGLDETAPVALTAYGDRLFVSVGTQAGRRLLTARILKAGSLSVDEPDEVSLAAPADAGQPTAVFCAGESIVHIFPAQGGVTICRTTLYDAASESWFAEGEPLYACPIGLDLLTLANGAVMVEGEKRFSTGRLLGDRRLIGVCAAQDAVALTCASEVMLVSAKDGTTIDTITATDVARVFNRKGNVEFTDSCMSCDGKWYYMSLSCGSEEIWIRMNCSGLPHTDPSSEGAWTVELILSRQR